MLDKLTRPAEETARETTEAWLRGRDTVAHEFARYAREARADGFRLDTAALAPRNAVVAGREVIEAILAFDSANGPGYGALRLLPATSELAKAWTISTALDFDRLCHARVRRAAPESQMRDVAGPDWIEQRQASSAYGAPARPLVHRRRVLAGAHLQPLHRAAHRRDRTGADGEEHRGAD